MPPRKLQFTSKFEKDYLRMARRGKNMDKLDEAVRLLEKGGGLPQSYRDHALTGEWKDCRDIHLEPDWLLLYALGNDWVRLVRTGTHADLFR